MLHLASSQGCSKYQFARELAAAAGFDPDRVLQANLESAALVAPRPRDVTLKVTRATQVLGERLPSLGEGLAAYVAEESTGNPAGSCGTR